MKKLKRLFAVCMTVMMVIGYMPTSAFAEAPNTETPKASIKTDKDNIVYPVITGHEYKDDHFDLVEWAPYIDAEKHDVVEFYSDYQELADLKDEEKEAAESELMAFVEDRIEEASKDAEEPLEVEDLTDLAQGIYYVSGEDKKPAFTEINENKEYKVELKDIEKDAEKDIEKDVKENAEPTEEKADEEQPGLKEKKSSALRTGGDVIERINISYSGSGSLQTIDDTEVYVISNPNNNYNYASTSGVYSVNFNLNRDTDYAPGEIELHIPAHLITDRTPDDTSTYSNKYYLDSCTLPVPPAPQTGAKNFNYTYDEENNEYILTNTTTIPAVYAGIFEFAYASSNGRSADFIDGIIDGHLNPNTNMTPFTALLKVGEQTKTETATPVYYDTKTYQFSITESNTSGNPKADVFHKTWPDKWGDAPADADDYYYYEYSPYYYPSSYNTQPFTLTMEVDELNEGGEVINSKWVSYSNGTSYDLLDSSERGVPTGNTSLELLAFDHPRSTYGSIQPATFLIRYPKANLEDGQEHELTRTVHAKTVGLDDNVEFTAEKSGSYTYKTTTFIPSGDSLSMEKYGYNGGNQLNAFELDQSAHVYFSNALYAQFPSLTFREGGDPSNIEDYEQTPYKTVFIDDHFYVKNGSNYIRLNSGDYEIECVTLSQDVYKYQENTSTHKYDLVYDYDYADHPSVDLYVKYDSAEWTKIGKFDRYLNGTNYKTRFVWEDSSKTPIDSWKVPLPEGVTGVKIISESVHAKKNLSVYTYFRILPTEQMKQLASENSTLTFCNVNSGYVEDSEGTIYGSNSPASIDAANIEQDDISEYGTKLKHVTTSTNLTGGYSNISVSKSTYGGFTNDTINARVVAHYRMYAYENFGYPTYSDNTLDDLFDKGIIKEQGTGTFYDLLPIGSTLDPKTIKVYGAAPYQSTTGVGNNTWTYWYGSISNSHKATYTYELIPNWRDSGRTMFILHTQNASDRHNIGFDVYYDVYYPWNSMIDYGKSLQNSVAYKTCNDRCGYGATTSIGYPDNANYNSFTTEEKSYFTDLDEDGNPDDGKYQYMYAKSTATINVVTAASLSLAKTVKSEDAAFYSDGKETHDTATAGKTYSYQIHFGADKDTVVSNMLVLDKIEDFKPAGVEDNWKGVLESIDLTQPRRRGIAPVVYYSTRDDIDFSGSNPADADITNSDIWTTTVPEDKKDIKAIAIDLSKKANGDPFELKEEETISIFLNMRAPFENAVEYANNNVKAYNEVYLKSQLSTTTGSTTSNFQQQGYTELGLNYEITNVTGSKVWMDRSSERDDRPDSVTVNLLRNGTKIDEQEVSADTDWSYAFNSVPIYDDTGNRYEYTVTEDPVEKYNTTIEATPISKKGLLIHFSPDMTSCNDSSYVRFYYTNGSTTKVTANLKLNAIADKTLYIPSDSTYIYQNIYGFDEFKIDNVAVVTKGSTKGNITTTFTNSSVPSFNKTYRGMDFPSMKGTLAQSTQSETVLYDSTGIISYNVINSQKVIPSIAGEKVWVDDDETYRPDSITINLLQNGEDFRSTEVTADDEWKFEFKNIPVYDENLEEYEYTITEDPIANYKAKISTSKGVAIKFGDTFATESTNDYLKIYYRDPETSAIRLLTGQGAYGTTGFCGSGTNMAGKTVYVPSKDIYFYWHSDVSVVNYGFAIDDISPAIINTDEVSITSNSASLPNYTPIELNGNEYPETAHDHGNNENILWHAEISGGAEMGIINTCVYKKVAGHIDWQNDQASDRPESVTLNVIDDKGNSVPVTTDAAHNWEYSTYVPRFKDDETEYQYKVSENSVEDYLTKYGTGDSAVTEPTYGTYDVLNYRNKRTITGTVTWINDNASNRPESLTITLLNYDTTVTTTTITADDDWQYSFEVPKYTDDWEVIDYSVSSEDVSKYSHVYKKGKYAYADPTLDFFDIEYSWNSRVITITKRWTISDKETGNPTDIPDSINVHLIRKPQDQSLIERILSTIFGTERNKDADADYEYQELNEYVTTAAKWKKNGNTWTYKFALPVNEADWQVWEEPTTWFTTSAPESDPVDVENNAVTITNTHIPNIAISGTKTWVNDEAADRPENITLELLQDGNTVVDTIEVPNTQTEWQFPKHEKYKTDGTEHKYKVREVAVSGYDTTYAGRTTGSKITFGTFNTYNSNDYLQIYYVKDGKTFLYTTGSNNGKFYGSGTYGLNNRTVNIPSNEIYFYWHTDSSSVAYGFQINSIEPASVANPSAVSAATLPNYTPIERSGTNYPATNHNYSNNDNKLWKYTTTPVAINASSEPAVGAVLITNTANWRTIEGTKEWVNDSPEDRPDSITIDLLQDGTVVDTTTTDAAHNWEYAFDTHKSYPIHNAQGVDYKYSVRERAVANYLTHYMRNEDVQKEKLTNGSSVTFGSFGTNGSSNYLEIYYVRDGRTYQYTTGSYNGKFYGTGTYSLSNKTIQIPATELYFRYYNYSSSYYGFKVNKIEGAEVTPPASETTATLPSVNVINSTGTSYPESYHYSSQQAMWRYITTPKTVQYTVNEPVPHEEPVENVFTIRNTANWRTISGQKTWTNDSPSDRPASITVDLLRNGEVFDTTTTDAAHDWVYNFDEHKKYPIYDSNGNEYEYSVKEHAVDWYTTQYEAAVPTNGVKVTFDNRFRTYYNSSNSGLQIYYKLDGDLHMLTGQGQSQTGIWYGTSLAGKTIKIPSHEFYIYWRGGYNYNNSTYYGFKVSKIEDARIDPSEVTGTLSTTTFSNTIQASKTALPETAHPYASYVPMTWYYNDSNPDTAIDWDWTESSMVDHFDITNRGNKRLISGTKTWIDEDETKRPDSITIDLYQDNEKVDTTTTDASDNWEYSFGYWPELKTNGEAYAYKVEERPLRDYLASYDTAGSRTKGMAITFADTFSTSNINTDYVQIYYKNANGTTYRLFGQGSDNGRWGGPQNSSTSLAGKTIYVPSTDAHVYWLSGSDESDYGFEVTDIRYVVFDDTTRGISDHWVNSPVYIEFNGHNYPKTKHNYDTHDLSIWHISLPNGAYSATDECLNISNEYNRRDISSAIQFVGEDDTAQRPENVTVELLRNGEVIDSTTTNEANNWEFEFTDLLKKDENGWTYEYSVRESEVDDYFTKYTDDTYDEDYILSDWDAASNFYTEPTSECFNIINRYKKQTLTGQKFWQGDTPEDRPDSITVKLYSSEEFMTEEEWQDSTNLLNTPVWSKIINLIRNLVTGDYHTSQETLGIKLVGEKTVTADDEWKYTFENVPTMDADGNTLYYRIEEAPFEGNYEPVYTTTITASYSDEEIDIVTPVSTYIGNLNVTNVYQTTDISGVKEWEGGTPPESVTLELYQDGIKVAETEATAANGWKYSFGKYPVKGKDGHTYAYRINEHQVEGFIPEYSEYNAVKVHLDSYTEMGNMTMALFRYKGDWYTEEIRPNDTINPDPTVIIPSTEFYVFASGKSNVPTVEPAILDSQTRTAVEKARTTGDSTYNLKTDQDDLTISYYKGSSGNDYSNDAPNAVIMREVGFELIADSYSVILDGSELNSGMIASNIEVTDEYINLMKLQYGIDESSDEWDSFIEEITEQFKEMSYAIRYNFYPGKIKNISLDAKTSLSGKKDWKEDDASKRPESIVINLYQDGEKYDSQTVSESTNWRYDFKDIPKFDAEGNTHTYTVQEDVVKGYKDTYAAHDGLRVQLSSDEESLDFVKLSVKKDGTWYEYDPGSAGMSTEIIVPGEEIAVTFDGGASTEQIQNLYAQGIDNVISVERVDEICFPYKLTERSDEITWTDRNGKVRALTGGGSSYVPPSQNTKPANATFVFSQNNYYDEAIFYIKDGSVYRMTGNSGAVPSNEIYVEDAFRPSYSYDASSTDTPRINATRIYAEKFAPAEYVCTEEEFRAQTESDALYGSTYPLVWSDSASNQYRDAFQAYLDDNGYNWNDYRYTTYMIRSHVDTSSSAGSIYYQDITETGSGSIKTSDALKTSALALTFGNGNSSKVRETMHDDLLDEDVPVYAGHVNIIYEGANGHAYLWYGDYTDWVDMLNGKTLYIPSGKFWITFYDEYGDPLDDADPVLDIASIEEQTVSSPDCIDALDMGMSVEDFFAAANFTGEVKELTAGEPIHPKNGAEVIDTSEAFSASAANTIHISSTTDSDTQMLLYDSLDGRGEYRLFIGDDLITHDTIDWQDTTIIPLLVNGEEVGTLTSVYSIDSESPDGDWTDEIDIVFNSEYADKKFTISKVDENENKISSYRYSAAYNVDRELTPVAGQSNALGSQRIVLRYRALPNENSITNTYYEGEFKLQKKGILNSLLPGTEFSLFFADRDWTQLEDEPTAVGVVGEDGRLTFSNIPYGHYLLFETGTVDGYKSVTEPWKVMITETGAAEINGGDGKLTPVEGTTKVYDDTNGMEIKFSPETDITEAVFYCVIDGLVYEYVYSPGTSLAGKTVELPSKEIYVYTTYSMDSGQSGGSSYGFKAASVKPKQVRFNGQEMHYLGNRAEVLDYLQMLEDMELAAIHECNGNLESLHYMPSDVMSDVYHYKYSYADDGNYIERPTFTDRPGLKIKFAEQQGDTDNIVIAYVYKDMLYAVTWDDIENDLQNELFTRTQLSNAEFCIPAEKVYILGLDGDTAAIESIENIEMSASAVEANIATCVPLGSYDEDTPYDLTNLPVSLNDDDIVYMTACKKLSSFTDYPEDPAIPMVKRLSSGGSNMMFGANAQMYTYAESQASTESSSVTIPSEGLKIEFGDGSVTPEGTGMQMLIMSSDDEGNAYVGSIYDSETDDETYWIRSADQLNGKTMYLPGKYITIYCYGDKDTYIDIDSITATEIPASERQKLGTVRTRFSTEMGDPGMILAEISMDTPFTKKLSGGKEILHLGEDVDDESSRLAVRYIYGDPEPVEHGLKVTFGDDGSVDDDHRVSLFYGRDNGLYIPGGAYYTTYENLKGKTFYLPATEVALFFQPRNNTWDKDTTAMHIMSIEEIDFTEEQGREAGFYKFSEWNPELANVEYIMITEELKDVTKETLTGEEQMLYPGDLMSEEYWTSSHSNNSWLDGVFYDYNMKSAEEIMPDTGITVTLGQDSHIDDNSSYMPIVKVDGQYVYTDMRIDKYMLEDIMANGGTFSIPNAEELYIVYDNGMNGSPSTNVNQGDNVLDIASITKGDIVMDDLSMKFFEEMMETMIYGGYYSQMAEQELNQAAAYGETELTGRAQKLDIAVDGMDSNAPYHIWGTDKIKKSFLPTFIENLLTPEKPVYEITNEQTVTEVSFVNEDGDLLGGGTLQLIDENGEVIEEWQTVAGEIHTIKGLVEGKTYTIHQTEAPALYNKSDDVEFTVNKAETTEVEVVNRKAKNVIVETVVTGSGAEKTDDFSYTMNVTGAKASTDYTITLPNDGTVTLTTDDEGKGTATFTLKHGQTAELIGLPTGASASVTQAACTYVASYKVTNDNKAQNDEVETAITASVEMETSDISIKFTNSKTLPVPTGVKKAKKGLMAISMLLICLLALVAREIRRRPAYSKK